MLKGWTVQRATGTGMVAGLAALLLWVAYAAYPQTLRLPFGIALAATAACGLSILWISAVDAVRNSRGARLVPIRTFDVAVGLLFAGPSLLALEALFGL